MVAEAAVANPAGKGPSPAGQYRARRQKSSRGDEMGAVEPHAARSFTARGPRTLSDYRGFDVEFEKRRPKIGAMTLT